MKKVLFVLLLASSFFALGQKTVQFADPLPPEYKLVPHVDPALYGTYENESSGTRYELDENGVAIVSTIISFVTREQVRESSTIQVRNNHLFGIKPNDSIPCVLEGERYYYGIRDKKVIVGQGSLHMLTRIDSKTYVLNFQEGLYFEPSMITFTGKSMEIVHGSNEFIPELSSVLVINNIVRYNAPVVVIAPSAEQWPRLRKVLFEGEVLKYGKADL